MLNRTRFFLILAAFSVLLFAANSDAEVKFGVRAGAYFDASSAFIGGEVLTPVFGDQWFFNPNVEYVFVDNGNLWTFNFDFHYDLNTSSNLYMWLGAGPAIIYRHRDFPRVDRTNTDFGANLLFGVGFPLRHSNLIPYIQPKVILSDNSEFSLAFGLRF